MVYGGNSKTTWETFQDLEEKLRAVHTNKYSYNNSVFVNARTPMLITCPVHGDFLQRPRDHKRGQGCRKCFEAESAVTRTKDIDTLIEELMLITRFNYPTLTNTSLIKSHDRVLTECVECGTKKSHKVCNILTGHSGCKECNYSINLWSEKRYDNKETVLYFIRINNLFKVGLTRKSVASRYYKELRAGYDIEVIFTIRYEDGAEAFREERRILKEYSKFKYKGDKMLINGGDSELFTTDVFQHGGVPSTL